MPFAEQWKKWLSNCARDAGTSPKLTIPREPSGRPMFAMLSGQDLLVVACFAECWQLYAQGDDRGMRAAITCARALLPALQEKCHPFARDLIARSLDWSDRDRVWALTLERPADRAQQAPPNGNRRP